ncbi:hypothetical protein [Elizabethkingia meningoseptica]|uniref:hypothetical protein n=1 Tax=Elizabethkingia meningoseptica TaxID=238 RepID=UPI001115CEB1|nr:hypothetical protein [Elizabethkingia meningoseptica]
MEDKNRYVTIKIDTKGYDVFYNETVTKLNRVIPKKTTFYGKPLSVFLDELKRNNVEPIDGLYRSYENNELWQPNGLELSFIDWDMRHAINNLEQKKSYPSIEITFMETFNNAKASKVTLDNYAQWNDNLINFYKNMIVKEIKFRNVFGVDTWGGNKSK